MTMAAGQTALQGGQRPTGAGRRRLGLLAGLSPLLLLPAAPPHRGPEAAVTIPFTLDEARLYVPVATPDGRERSFILDTGASPTVIDAGVARDLKLAVSGGVAVRGAGSGSTMVGESGSLDLRVGAVPLRPATVSVAPLDSLLGPHIGRRIDGIIGSQFFAEHVVEVDFDAGVLRVHPAAGYRYAGSGTVVPVELRAGVPIATGTVGLPGGQTVAARMLVDLGAKANALFTEPFIAAQGLDTIIPGGAIATLGAGVGGETRYRFVRLPALGVGRDAATRQDSVIAGLSIAGTLRGSAYDVLLGTGFLERYRLIIDHARRRHIYEPRRTRHRPDAFDMSGMYLVAADVPGRRLRVLRVESGSPAEEAGLRPGDELVQIDGRGAESLTLSEARALLREGDRRRVPIAYVRDGRRATTTMMLRRRL